MNFRLQRKRGPRVQSRLDRARTLRKGEPCRISNSFNMTAGLQDRDIEIFSYCMAELRLRRFSRSKRHRAALSKGGLVPVPWIQEAAFTCRSLKSSVAEDCTCHVYVILLNRNGTVDRAQVHRTQSAWFLRH